jgi:putative phage-type endonuclease
MKTIPHRQGSPEWHAWRASRFTASDAAAMLGISPYKTRDELLREKATGITPEFDDATLERFARGHALEEAARQPAEEIIGSALYPSAGECEDWPLIAASFDGITMDDSILWEHKTLNAELREAEELPAHYVAQVEQQLLVSDAEKCLFTATDGRGGEKSFIVFPNELRRQQIIDGWRQFEKDLAEYTPPAAVEPPPVGRSPENLPVPRIEVTGKVISSNIKEFRAHALEVIGGINTELVTDTHFTDAEKTVKWCKNAETRLEAAKAHALAQTASIEEIFRVIDDVNEQLKQKRLTLEKLVKTRKEEIKTSIVTDGLVKFRAHTAALQGEIGTAVDLRIGQPPFGEAVKGLKTLASIQNAVDTALANAKIEADTKAKDVRVKLAWFAENTEDHRALFADLQILIEKPLDDFQRAVTSRIGQFEREQAERRAHAEKAKAQATDAVAKAAAQAAATVESGMPSPSGAQTIETAKPLPKMDTDMIRDFLKARGFGKDESRIRAILVEFVKFCDGETAKWTQQATSAA